MFEDTLRNKPSILGSTPPSDSSNSYRKKEELLGEVKAIKGSFAELHFYHEQW